MDDSAYYATVAQVLPVLALVLWLELRVFGNWSEWWKHGDPDKANIPFVWALTGLCFGALFFLAEAAALNALKNGKPSTFGEDIVPIAMDLYLIMVILIPIQPHFEAVMDRIPFMRRLRLWSYGRQRARRERDHVSAAPQPPPESHGDGGLDHQ